MQSPIFHLHVRVIKKRRDQNGTWYALFRDQAMQDTWMEQPEEPTVGDEQILYAVKGEAPEVQLMEFLLEHKAPRELVHLFLEGLAHHYGEWCEKTWEEAKASCIAPIAVRKH